MMEAGINAEDQAKLLEQKRKSFEGVKRVQEHFLPYVLFDGEQYVPKRIEYQKKAIWINAAWWTFSEMVIQLLMEKNEEVKNAIQKKVPEGFVLVPKCKSESFSQELDDYLDDLWKSGNAFDDGFVSVNEIDHDKIWSLVIKAQEQGQ